MKKVYKKIRFLLFPTCILMMCWNQLSMVKHQEIQNKRIQFNQETLIELMEIDSLLWDYIKPN